MPDEMAKRNIIVKVFPKTVITKPSEWKVYSSGRLHKTQERTAKVYPELSRGDTVFVSGFFSEGTLYAIMLLNQTVGITTEFIESEVKLKKGTLSSFRIKNPILIQSENMIKSLLEEK